MLSKWLIISVLYAPLLLGMEPSTPSLPKTVTQCTSNIHTTQRHGVSSIALIDQKTTKKTELTTTFWPTTLNTIAQPYREEDHSTQKNMFPFTLVAAGKKIQLFDMRTTAVHPVTTLMLDACVHTKEALQYDGPNDTSCLVVAHNTVAASSKNTSPLATYALVLYALPQKANIFKSLPYTIATEKYQGTVNALALHKKSNLVCCATTENGVLSLATYLFHRNATLPSMRKLIIQRDKCPISMPLLAVRFVTATVLLGITHAGSLVRYTLDAPHNKEQIITVKDKNGAARTLLHLAVNPLMPGMIVFIDDLYRLCYLWTRQQNNRAMSFRCLKYFTKKTAPSDLWCYGDYIGWCTEKPTIKNNIMSDRMSHCYRLWIYPGASDYLPLII